MSNKGDSSNPATEQAQRTQRKMTRTRPTSNPHSKDNSTGSDSCDRNHGNQVGSTYVGNQTQTKTVDQRQRVSDRDPERKPLIIDPADSTVGRKVMNDPFKDGGLKAPIMADETLPNSDYTDGTANRILTQWNVKR